MRRRIIICLGLLLALCLLGNAIAILYLGRSTRELSALAESHRIQSMRAALSSAGVRVERDLLAHLAGHDDKPRQRADSIRRFRESLRQCASCHHEPSIQAQLDAIHTSFDAYLAAGERLPVGGEAEGMTGVEQEAVALARRLIQQTTGVADRASRHLAARSTNAAASIRNAWLVVSGTLLATLVCGGIVAFHLKRRLTKPVEALLEGIKRVRQGDMPYRFSINADEEFRVLADAFDRAYKDLKNAQDGILQAEKMAAVGKLAAGVAHEVGNPLASLSSIAQMMRRHCESDEQAERIDLIMQQIARISRIVRELLSFSRPAADKEQTRVEVGELLERAVTLLGYDKRARSIRVTCRNDPALPAVRADSDRLLLVFTNIMMNAFDAMCPVEGGSGALAITAQQESGRVIVRFEDNGPGMSEQEVANAFEPFFTTKEPGAGTGLGLWVCYQVIRSHNGAIRIDSAVGKGTTVTVELPREPRPTGPEDGGRSDEEDQQSKRLASQPTGTQSTSLPART